jgi:hypothetical protein
MNFGKTVREWLWPSERRRAKRRSAIPLVAYFWDGGEPRAWQVRNISPKGMYLLTEQRWYRNTLVTMTLTRTDRDESDPKRSVRVVARAIWSAGDGVGLAFVYPPKDRNVTGSGGRQGQVDQKMLVSFLRGLPGNTKRAFADVGTVAKATMNC